LGELCGVGALVEVAQIEQAGFEGPWAAFSMCHLGLFRPALKGVWRLFLASIIALVRSEQW
jgi:hypothetical protein